MTTSNPEFANYCCELLSSAGHCVAKRMFGGYGISTEGLTLAILADLGGGEKLWLKADEDTRGTYEAEGCERFSYAVHRDGKDTSHSLNYYSAPEEAMESPELMRPWASLALQCALKARSAKSTPKKTRTPRAPAKKKPRSKKT